MASTSKKRRILKLRFGRVLNPIPKIYGGWVLAKGFGTGGLESLDLCFGRFWFKEKGSLNLKGLRSRLEEV